MTIQETLNKLDKNAKNQTKNISFQYGNNQPNFSGETTLNIYDHDNRNTELLKGNLNLAQFPNLRKITFAYNLRVNSLENIDISENTNLSRIIIGQNNQNNTLKDSNCAFFAKEKQLNQLVIRYYYRSEMGNWIEKKRTPKKTNNNPNFFNWR